MWDHSVLTSAGQLGALRLLSEWLDSSRRSRGPWRLFRPVRAADGTVAPQTPGRRQGGSEVAGATR
jgi:hypothetical protein